MPVHLNRRIPIIKDSKIRVKGQTFKNFNKETFCIDLENADWSCRINEANPILRWDYFLKTFDDTCDVHAPIVNVTVGKNSPPWITQEIRKLI